MSYLPLEAYAGLLGIPKQIIPGLIEVTPIQKPHITPFRHESSKQLLWDCEGLGVTGTSWTPSRAYDRWLAGLAHLRQNRNA